MMTFRRAEKFAAGGQVLELAALRKRSALRRAAKRPAEHESRMVIDATDGAPADRVVCVKYGSVTVYGVEPDEATKRTRAREGREILERALRAFLTPGITITPEPGVPLFRVDPDDPSIIIRELDGATERGGLVNGAFAAIAG